MTKTLQAAAPALRTIWIDYTNYRGERAWREIEPTEARPALWFGRTEWHPADQWLLAAFDIEKRAVRDFAVASIHAWSQQKPAALSAPPPSEEEAVKELTTCNCRWRGEEQVQQCTLHEAHVHAIHEWAERAKTAEAALRSAQEDARKPSLHAKINRRGAEALIDELIATVRQAGYEDGYAAAMQKETP